MSDFRTSERRPKLSQKAKAVVLIVGMMLAGVIGLLAVQGRIGWTADTVGRMVAPEQKPEGNTYEATAKGPVSLATFVTDARKSWPGESVATVHEAAGELAEGMLHQGDIEVGSLEGTKFVPWSMPPWKAARRIHTELGAMNDFLSDEGRIVFRRK